MNKSADQAGADYGRQIAQTLEQSASFWSEQRPGDPVWALEGHAISALCAFDGVGTLEFPVMAFKSGQAPASAVGERVKLPDPDPELLDSLVGSLCRQEIDWAAASKHPQGPFFGACQSAYETLAAEWPALGSQDGHAGALGCLRTFNALLAGALLGQFEGFGPLELFALKTGQKPGPDAEKSDCAAGLADKFSLWQAQQTQKASRKAGAPAP